MPPESQARDCVPRRLWRFVLHADRLLVSAPTPSLLAMIRASRRRAAWLALTAVLATFLGAGSDRVLCIARDGHVAIEQAHWESGCLARPGAVASQKRRCVDLPLDIGLNTRTARAVGAGYRDAPSVGSIASELNEVAANPVTLRYGPARHSLGAIRAAGLRLETTVLLI